jgi:predicted transporter
MWTQLEPWQKALTGVIAVVGVIAIVCGIVYFLEPAHALPSFFPAHAARSNKHAVKHGIAALVVGVVLLIAAWMVPAISKSSRN